MRTTLLFTIISILLNFETSAAKSMNQLGLIFTVEPGWQVVKKTTDGEFYAPSGANSEFVYVGKLRYQKNQIFNTNEALNAFNRVNAMDCPSYQTSKPSIQSIDHFDIAILESLCKEQGIFAKNLLIFGDEGIQELSIAFHSNDYVNKDIDSITLSNDNLKLVDSLFKSIKICDTQDPKIEDCQGVDYIL